MAQPHSTSGASLISLITLTTVNGFAAGAVIDKHTPSHFAPWQHTHTCIHTHTQVYAVKSTGNCQDITHTQAEMHNNRKDNYCGTVRNSLSSLKAQADLLLNFFVRFFSCCRNSWTWAHILVIMIWNVYTWMWIRVFVLMIWIKCIAKSFIYAEFIHT